MACWDHILLWRGWREFKSGFACIMKITTFSLADQEHVNTAQVVELFLENHQDTSSFVHCTGVISEKCTQHCPCTTGIQQCLCMVGTKICDGSLWKLMFGGALSLFQSFKWGANGFPESMVTLWDMVSLFYSKWAFNAVDIHLHLEPQNVKCASILEGRGICILCCRSHHMNIRCDMPCWLY